MPNWNNHHEDEVVASAHDDLMNGQRWILAGFILVIVCGSCRLSQQERPVVVFAAASLTEYLSQLAKDYELQFDKPIRLSFAASSILARQIQAGASADVYVSANPAWAQLLEAEILPRPMARSYLGNQMVLVAASGQPLPASLDQWRLDGDRVALGDPQHVPAGQYAALALKASGHWSEVSRRMIPTTNVREALRLVLAQECTWAIVYASDAKAAGIEGVLVPLPRGNTIEYFALQFPQHENESGNAFFEFLFSSHAESLAIRMGFQWIDP